MSLPKHDPPVASTPHFLRVVQALAGVSGIGPVAVVVGATLLAGAPGCSSAPLPFNGVPPDVTLDAGHPDADGGPQVPFDGGWQGVDSGPPHIPFDGGQTGTTDASPHDGGDAAADGGESIPGDAATDGFTPHDGAAQGVDAAPFPTDGGDADASAKDGGDAQAKRTTRSPRREVIV